MVLRKIIGQLEPLLGAYALPSAERLLQHLFSCTRTELYLDGDRKVDDGMQRQITVILNRCLTHEPLDYILGISYFYNREFTVSPAVLLPRPDTEVLIETVLQFEAGNVAFFADIGIGSGIISCILTEKNSTWIAVGIDNSMDALHIARINRQCDRIELVCADFLSSFSSRRQFDFIVSNPPYIPTPKIEELDKSVKCFEPRRALDGGDDGLNFYRLLAKEAPSFLKSGGYLYGEIGYDQEESIRKLFLTSGWNIPTFFKDLSGYSRVFRTRYGA
jgi:release factor glutamine methyltransferase